MGLWFFRYFSLICQSCCGNPTVIKPTIWHWSDQISWSVYLDGPQNDDASSNVNRLPDSRAVKFITVELPLVAGPRVLSPETVSRYRYEIGNLICNQYFHSRLSESLMIVFPVCDLISRLISLYVVVSYLENVAMFGRTMFRTQLYSSFRPKLLNMLLTLNILLTL